MYDDPKDSASPDLDELYAQVPPDFPRPQHLGAVSGAQPKLLATQYKGKFYAPGATPPELYERWDLCEDLARQFKEKSLESKAGKRSAMSEVDILNQYLERLLKTGWVSDAEGRWTIRRASVLLEWPAPAAAHEPEAPDPAT